MGHPSHHAADASRVPQSGELGFAARPLCAPNHVHAPLFPFERTEQWMVLLVDVKANKLVGYQKLSQNSRFETVNQKVMEKAADAQQIKDLKKYMAAVPKELKASHNYIGPI